MKNTFFSKAQLFLSLVFGLVLSGAVGWPLHAQPETAKSDSLSATAPDPWERQVPKVSFDGIPLGEVVTFLREQFPEINFVPVGEAATHAVFCELRLVGLADILKVFELASNGSLRVTRENERLISFTLHDPPLVQAPTGSDPPALCRVFNLSPYMDGKSPEELDRAINAIEEAVAISMKMMAKLGDSQGLSRDQMPEMSVHRETKLLIVVGRPGPSMDAVEQVVMALQGNKPYGYGGYGVVMPGPALPPRMPSIPTPSRNIRSPVAAPAAQAPPPPTVPPEPPAPSPDSTTKF